MSFRESLRVGRELGNTPPSIVDGLMETVRKTQSDPMPAPQVDDVKAKIQPAKEAASTVEASASIETQAAEVLQKRSGASAAATARWKERQVKEKQGKKKSKGKQ